MEVAVAERATIKDVYFHSMVLSAQSVKQFQFFEDASVHTGSDRYVLLAADQQPAIFHVSGILTHLSVTAAGAVKSRKLQAKVDEYIARVKIENEKDQGLRKMGLKLWFVCWKKQKRPAKT